MEENQIQTELDSVQEQISEPTEIDNSEDVLKEEVATSAEKDIQETGESLEENKDPVEELILGKFKSVEDLKKAYEELQRHQGQNSEELGSLRKELNSFKELKENLKLVENFKNVFVDVINRDMLKYNTPDYLQNPDFVNMYTQALAAFQGNLDTDSFVELMDSYVSSRIHSNDIKKSANSETQSVIDKMTYAKNPQSKFNPPKKNLDEMTEKEIEEMIERLI